MAYGFEICASSFNHYSYGAVCDFLFAGIAGIRPVMESPGYKHFLLNPSTGGTLKEAYAKYESLYGTIESSWKKNENNMKYTFQVPVNTTATVIIPAHETALETIKITYPDARYENKKIIFNIGSGRWQIVINF